MSYTKNTKGSLAGLLALSVMMGNDNRIVYGQKKAIKKKRTDPKKKAKRKMQKLSRRKNRQPKTYNGFADNRMCKN